jgi:hypothetical protein
MNLKNAAARCITLGSMSLVALGVSHLALTDIYHAEGDLTLEWNVLRACFMVIFSFQVYALRILGGVTRAS